MARHRLIDDHLRSKIRRDPGRRIFVLGAGFDTRAFRLPGGRWWEFDDPALFALKEERLPERSAPNPLLRRSIDFSRERIAKYLEPLAGNDEAVVVLEGVSMYLAPDALTTLASTVHAFLSAGGAHRRSHVTRVSPLVRPRFGQGARSPRRAHGGHDRPPAGSDRSRGLPAKGFKSIVGRAIEAGTLRMPRLVFNTLLRELRDGYAVWTFQSAT